MQVTEYRLQDTGLKSQNPEAIAKRKGMQSYKDLEIYKIAHQLAVEIHKMTLEKLPKFEMFEEGSQIRKSSKSIPATIAEGFGRKQYQQEFIKFLTYAIASLDETKEHLGLLQDTGSLAEKNLSQSLLVKYEELGKKIYRFRETVISRLGSKP